MHVRVEERDRKRKAYTSVSIKILHKLLDEDNQVLPQDYTVLHFERVKPHDSRDRSTIIDAFALRGESIRGTIATHARGGRTETR